MRKPRPDIEVHNHGSVAMIAVLTKRAQRWVDANVSLEGWQWMGHAFACEPRMVANLVDGMIGDGLEVK